MKKLLLMLVLCLAFIGFAQSAFAVGDATVDIAYSNPTGSPVVGFKVFIDGVERADVANQGGTATAIIADLPDPPPGGYAFTAKPYDASGRLGPVSNTVIKIWEPDLGAPSGTTTIQVTIDIKRTP